MSEYWGWCAGCQRSFYLGSTGSAAGPSRVECPVCLAPPAEIRIADPQPRHQVAPSAP